MRKLAKRFDEIWAQAEKRNRQEGNRFHKVYVQNKRYFTIGIYDGKTKRYCLFDTINLVGNFRYNARVIPAEFDEMEQLVRDA